MKSKLYFCVHKSRLQSYLRAAEPLAGHDCPGNGRNSLYFEIDYAMMKNKTKQLHIRLTEDELSDIKKRSLQFPSLSDFVIKSIKEFSDKNAHVKLEERSRLARFYSSFDEKLAHVGGNLNQAMRRINEYSNAGNPVHLLLKNELAPAVSECHALCNEIRVALRDMVSKNLQR